MMNQKPRVRRWFAPGRGDWLLAVADVFAVAVLVTIAITGRGRRRQAHRRTAPESR